jgi:hypothetical protein
MAETIFWWVFLFACVLAFFFGFGMVEDLSRKWHVRWRSRKDKLVSRAFRNSPDPKGNGNSDSLIH